MKRRYQDPWSEPDDYDDDPDRGNQEPDEVPDDDSHLHPYWTPESMEGP